MGVHPHAAMKGVQSPCPLLVPVFREAYDRTKPTEEGRVSALRGRLQSVDPTKLNARSSEVALVRPAPPGARRGEPAAVLLPVERERGRATRKKSRHRQRRSAYAFASARRYFRGSPPCPACASLEGGTDPWVHAPARGEGVR